MKSYGAGRTNPLRLRAAGAPRELYWIPAKERTYFSWRKKRLSGNDVKSQLELVFDFHRAPGGL